MSTHSNPELQLAHDFVEHTERNIFLTGKAGTGKTTFLHNLKKRTQKRMIVTGRCGGHQRRRGHPPFVFPLALRSLRAGQRGPAHSTIEGHLAGFVETGRIDIRRLLNEEELKTIDRQLTAMKDKPLGEIRKASCLTPECR